MHASIILTYKACIEAIHHLYIPAYNADEGYQKWRKHNLQQQFTSLYTTNRVLLANLETRDYVLPANLGNQKTYNKV